MLIERAEFADLDALAVHRQAAWERQRLYVAACSTLHRRLWGAATPPPPSVFVSGSGLLPERRWP